MIRALLPRDKEKAGDRDHAGTTRARRPHRAAPVLDGGGARWRVGVGACAAAIALALALPASPGYADSERRSPEAGDLSDPTAQSSCEKALNRAGVVTAFARVPLGNRLGPLRGGCMAEGTLRIAGPRLDDSVQGPARLRAQGQTVVGGGTAGRADRLAAVEPGTGRVEAQSGASSGSGVRVEWTTTAAPLAPGKWQPVCGHVYNDTPQVPREIRLLVEARDSAGRIVDSRAEYVLGYVAPWGRTFFCSVALAGSRYSVTVLGVEWTSDR